MKFTSEIIDFSNLSEAEIKAKLKELQIALTVDEILKIQKEILKRPPSLTECILWSIEGSEHCSYKSSRPFLKQFHTSSSNVILGPSEDAGIVEIARDNQGHKYGLVISHESHNHPSQIVPYEGAATGVGGNIRDVCCMGAKVIASADPLRFGELSKHKSKWIEDGVVSGIAGYGNPVGIPMIAGDVYFHESYNENCLVNVVTMGVLREDEIIHSYAPENADGYNLILIGKPTDNSGFGGASFASVEMKEEDKELNKGAVQEPNAFLKRHLLKSTYALFKILKEKNLLSKVGFKDLGGGGIACVSVELADSGGYGAEVNLDQVHVSVENLHPAVILCSETQERFMWAAAPEVTDLILEHYNTTFDLPHVSAGAKASVVGKIRKDGQYIVTHRGQEVVNARAADVTKGLLYNRAFVKPENTSIEPILAEPKDYNQVLLKMLAHENVACRVPIYEQYDKQVQGITVLEPGEADAGVMQPFKDDQYPIEIRKTGIALSVDHNPRYNQIDPYWGSANAVVESMRNVAAVGATPWAITDCLCFGNPEKPDQMGQFVESTRGVAEACKAMHLKDYPTEPVPIVSGNVSLYNESKGKAVVASAIISCLGKIKDVSKVITMSFKKSDSVIVLIGERKDELGGSVYYDLLGELGANVPKTDFAEAEKEIFGLTDAIEQGLVLSAHDISDGGLAVAVAEMSFKNEIGCNIEIPGNLNDVQKLFSETGGFVLEVETQNVASLQNVLEKYNLPFYEIGKTTKDKRIKMNNVVDLELTKAKKEWSEGLRNKL